MVRRKRRLGPRVPVEPGASTTREPLESVTEVVTDDGLAILVGGLVLGIAIRLLVILTGVEVADVQHLHDVGEFFLSGKNPYSLPPFQSNFPPVALGLEVGAILLSRLTSVPFHIVFKFWPLTADIATALMLYRFLRRGHRSPRVAARWTCVFLLNPISIIITAAHGQLDPVTNFLSLLALVLLAWKPSRWFGWSAICLGFAIAIKPNPALLLPVLVTAPGLASRQRLTYLAIACVPTGLSLLPFFLDNPQGVIGNVFTYAGEYDFGYAAVLRGAWYLKTGSTWLPGTVGDDFTHTTRLTFVAAYLVLLAVGVGRVSLPKLATMVYVLFHTMFTGLSAQYSIWVVPFAILAADWFVLVYTVGTTLALLGFYFVFWPSILLGAFNPYQPFMVQFRPWYFWGMLASWLANAAWMARLVVEITHRRGRNFAQFVWWSIQSLTYWIRVAACVRQVIVVVGLAALIVSLVPVIRLIGVMIHALQQ